MCVVKRINDGCVRTQVVRTIPTSAYVYIWWRGLEFMLQTLLQQEARTGRRCWAVTLYDLNGFRHAKCARYHLIEQRARVAA